MKVGDMIKAVTDRTWSRSRPKPSEPIGLLVRIGRRHNNRRVGTVLTDRGIETWPLDSHYEYEVISESR